jgi:intracellular septation protein
MGHAVNVPAPIWSRLNLVWSLFFFLLGFANLFVVYVWSGFYEAQQAMILATGKGEIDLTACADQFTGALLGLCQDAQSREEVWVNFKLFGMMGLTILFVVAQALFLARHVKDEPETAETD